MFFLLRLATKLINDPGAHIMYGQIRCSGYTSGGQCFEDDRSLQSWQPRSAFAIYGCEAHLCSLSKRLNGEVFLLLPLYGIRTQLFLSEIECLRPEGEQIFTEGVVLKLVNSVVDVRPIVDGEGGLEDEWGGGFGKLAEEGWGYFVDHY